MRIPFKVYKVRTAGQVCNLWTLGEQPGCNNCQKTLLFTVKHNEQGETVNSLYFWVKSAFSDRYGGFILPNHHQK
jgi:hypothetical protein